ncbi:uncharacterized protein LOC131674877 [Phymastichus coffea]|uniref:uncharacterized protein LOC131674877 n=1 Tax=Phymastichus coffea TaxID=108790 RepID=UPI00273B5093|nr:uncharacterized protein LOC131674877 [Phymastichus coffea]
MRSGSVARLTPAESERAARSRAQAGSRDRTARSTTAPATAATTPGEGAHPWGQANAKLFLRSRSPCGERGFEQQQHLADGERSADEAEGPPDCELGTMPEAAAAGAIGLLGDETDNSTFENKSGLAEDMKFLARMPELCDVTFLVGETREPVCAVKAVLAARSKVFHKMLYTAPSPQRKKEPPPKENKLKLFLKRSSEPLLNLQNAAQQRSGFTQQLASIQEPYYHHTLVIDEFEPDVFRQLIEYIHTGSVTLQPRTLLGVMNAADYYGLDELRRACAGFVQCCITVDTVCALLASAERYIQYKCTKSLVQKVLEFVDERGNEVLNLGSFTLLPQHVVRLILAREELRADEFTKFQAALMWSKKYCDSNPTIDLKEVINNFIEYIQFHKIPANVLMHEVHPLGLVPNTTIVNALAYQADPTSVDPGQLSPHRVRRQGRSMSVQSSLDPYGSSVTLNSLGSDAGSGSDQRQHSVAACLACHQSTAGSGAESLSIEEEPPSAEDDEVAAVLNRRILVRADVELVTSPPSPVVEPPTPTPPPPQPPATRAPDSTGLYIRMVLRQEGRLSNHVWLYKTHKLPKIDWWYSETMVRMKEREALIRTTYYLMPGQTLENTKVSERALALIVPKAAYARIQECAYENDRAALLAEREAKRLADLKKASYEMSKAWEDTAENIQRRRKEELLSRRKLEEADRLEFMRQMAAKNAQERAEVVKQAREMLLYRKPQCRLINRALLTSEVFRELNEQTKFQNSIKHLNENIDKEFAERVAQDIDKFHREEREKRETRMKKLKDHQQEILEQIEQNKKTTKKLQESSRQSEIEDQANMTREIKEIEERESRDALRKKEQLSKIFLEAIEEKREYERKLREEDEFQNRNIAIYNEMKREMEKMSKEKALIARQEKARKVDSLARKLAERIAGRRRLEKDEDEKTRRMEDAQKAEDVSRLAEQRLKREKVRQEAQRQMKSLEDQQRKRKLERDELKLWDTLQRYKRDEFDREWNVQMREQERNKRLDYGGVLKKQMAEKNAQRKKAEIEADDSVQTKETINKANEKVLAYAESILRESRGVRPTFPIEKAIEQFKRDVGLIPFRRAVESEVVQEMPRRRRQKRAVCPPSANDESAFVFA